MFNPFRNSTTRTQHQPLFTFATPGPTRRDNTIPTADVSHAAHVACQAARSARLAGADPEAAQAAYDLAYQRALTGQSSLSALSI